MQYKKTNKSLKDKNALDNDLSILLSSLNKHIDQVKDSIFKFNVASDNFGVVTDNIINREPIKLQNNR